MAAVSVVVATRNPGSALPGMLQAIDAQTLPASEFELLVADASTDASADRLRQVAGRRPNITVLAADAGVPEADRIGRAVEAATGEFLLHVVQGQRLAPRALEVLLEQARRSGADLVLGRVVSPGASGSPSLPDDADRLDGAQPDPARTVALVRRSLLADGPDAGAALLDLPALAGRAGTIAVLARYACATQGVGRPAAPRDLTLESTEHRWEGGALHVKTTARRAQPGVVPTHAWLVAVRDLAEVALPATVAPGTDGLLTVTAALDPSTAEAGRPLEDGLWELRIRLAWPDRETTLPLPARPARSALLDGRPHVARGDRGVLHLDAGATQSSAIGPVPQTRASVAESARGTLVTFHYPTVHAQGDAVLQARLLLGSFGLPARLVCEDGRARLEAWASSLAGSSDVSVVAGGGRPVATGLRLTVDGTGRMRFSPAPPPRADGSPHRPLVQRVRRGLPGALEPTVRRLSQVPVLRRTYQRLLNR